MSHGAVPPSPTLSDFFLRLNFELGLNPTPKYGIERTQVASRVAAHLVIMAKDGALPQGLRKNLWIRALPIDSILMFENITTRDLEFALALADTYLDWLYAHAR